MNQEKILEQFHYFNFNSDIDSVYANWAVSTGGDVVNCLYPYAILAIHFKDTEVDGENKNKGLVQARMRRGFKLGIDKSE